MTALNDLQQSLFDKYPRIVVPLSFLLDRGGNVGVMYRGAVGLDVVFDDMAILSHSNEKLRDLASPFTGRWFTKPASQSEFIEYVAKRLYPRDQRLGLYYFEMARNAEQDAKRKAYLGSQLVSTYRKLGRAAANNGEHDAAESHLQKALTLSNGAELPAVHHDLGLLFASQDDFVSAEQHLRETLRLSPDFPNAQRNLNLMLQKLGK